MCGITGWVSFERDLGYEGKTLDRMTETMACRGPDASGVYLDRHGGLGHRRLAVIDIPGGSQPMVAEVSGDSDGNKSIAIVYSGETYNYVELRDELRARGHVFRTESDTEVVLRGYLEWGAGVADRLNGMYAFAIWDGRTDRLVMIRDRMGIKPFYYYSTPDGILFGSEPKAILANPLAEAVLTLDGLREAATFIKTPGHSIFDGMRELLPGMILTLDRGGLRTHRYWRLETRPHPDDQDTSVAHVRELLDDIIRRQLISDVPLCTLLSGGLDSSAMTALAALQLGEAGDKVRSFAVDFVGQAENFVADDLRSTPDAPFVHEVAEHVNSEHSDIVLDAAALIDPAAREAVVRARDLPNGMGDMDTSLYLLFKAIRTHSTVALSGESADEVFGGYNFMHIPAVQQADMFPWIAGFTMAGQGAAEVFGVDRMYAGKLGSSLDLVGYVNDSYRTAIAEIDRLPGESDHEWRLRKMCYLCLTRFVQILLDRKDRLSMAVGLEVRVPFCDHRLVEYVFNTPWSMKTFDGREKSLLRHATKDVLPQSVVERVKSPYPSTQDPRYGEALGVALRELVTQTSHPVFDVLSIDWVSSLDDKERLASQFTRMTAERALGLATWLEVHKPRLSF